VHKASKQRPPKPITVFFFQRCNHSLAIISSGPCRSIGTLKPNSYEAPQDALEPIAKRLRDCHTPEFEQISPAHKKQHHSHELHVSGRQRTEELENVHVEISTIRQQKSDVDCDSTQSDVTRRHEIEDICAEDYCSTYCDLVYSSWLKYRCSTEKRIRENG
jgi:hypothetical protein